MASFIARRLILSLIVAFSVSILGFTLLRMSGDLAQSIAGVNATIQDVERVRGLYGLDKPLAWQYWVWLKNAISGDFGQSVFFQESVSNLIIRAFPTTCLLGLISICITILVGVPWGVVAAVHRGGLIDKAATIFSVAGQALPSFWLALMLIIIFGVNLQWLPISGSETWDSFILPSLALSIYSLPAIIKLVKSGMSHVLTADYIRTARAKGMEARTIIVRHALRNAVLPVVSTAAVKFGHMLGGSLVIESTFALHGLGYLGYESVRRADFPVVQAVVLILAFIFVMLTFLGDLLNALIDPRIRSRV